MLSLPSLVQPAQFTHNAFCFDNSPLPPGLTPPPHYSNATHVSFDLCRNSNGCWSLSALRARNGRKVSVVSELKLEYLQLRNVEGFIPPPRLCTRARGPRAALGSCLQGCTECGKAKESSCVPVSSAYLTIQLVNHNSAFMDRLCLHSTTLNVELCLLPSRMKPGL